MKKWYILIAASLLYVSVSGKTENLRAYFSYSSFYAPQHGSYLETYLSVLGSSVVYVKNDNGKYQGSLLITMLFKQQDSIRDFRKYELFSPEVDDTTSINFSFLDQQRIPLPDGEYEMELSIADKNRNKAPFVVNESIQLSYPADRICISGIELVESFVKATTETQITKNGYDFMPYLDYFYPASVNRLIYYAEIYNTNLKMQPDDRFVTSVTIQAFETGRMVASYQKVKRETPKAVNVVLGEFDITQLPSGNFNLVISVRDKENKEIVSNSMFFQRSNPSRTYDMQNLAAVITENSFVEAIRSLDTIREFTRMVFPIASADEKLFIRSNSRQADLNVLQQFFLTFWQSRNPQDPRSAWLAYYDQVLVVNKEFKSVNKKGYETDRGRVYLQFGPPNARTQSYDEPRAYPYEIWQYYKIGIQSNRKFVFFAREYASGDFELLHSDVQGEVYNPRWEIALHQRDTDRYKSPQQIDRMTEDDYWGKRSDDYYNLPR